MHIHNSYHCDFCRKEYQTTLDDSIQVTFTVHPDIRSISFHNPYSLTIQEYQYKFHFSREGKVPGSKQTFQSFFKGRERFLGFLEPGEKIVKEIQTEVGFLEGNDFLHHSDFLIEVKNEPNTENQKQVKIIFQDDKVLVDPIEIFQGKKDFEIQNLTDKKIPLSIYQLDKNFMTTEFALEFDPFLSAKDLLNHKTFRELFKGEDIVGATGIAIKDITILFTDLKGSTNLYERIGDLNAFSLVHQHFDEIGSVITRHNGILIKTIGDAIMASFLNPLDAIKASLEMLKAIEIFNSRQLEKEIILKIGIHSGPSIAVTLNERLDYFGQIVNVAARVQSVAEGEEICFTHEIYNFPGVKEILLDQKLKSEEVFLKGIKNSVSLFRLSN
jgi:class 3 adenylate cyclase